MRTGRRGFGTRWQFFSEVLLIVLLAACAVAPTAQPQRTYDRVRDDQLYLVTRTVFTGVGFKTIGPCHGTRICINTEWKEYDGDRRDGVAWRERRMYTARFVQDPLDDRQMFFLDLAVQERPLGGADWIDKPVVPASDVDYLRVLRDFDLAVRKLGGVQY